VLQGVQHPDSSPNRSDLSPAQIKPEHVNAWLNQDPATLHALYAIPNDPMIGRKRFTNIDWRRKRFP
jgi:hypothetical protein